MQQEPIPSCLLHFLMLLCPWNSPGQNTAVGSQSLLQEIFPTQGSNPGLPQCRRILYQLSHKGSPRILEWVAYTFPPQELNQGLLHCRWILYQLSYQGSPKNREGSEWQPTEYSCVENPMDRIAWWATVCGVTKSQTQLSD